MRLRLTSIRLQLVAGTILVSALVALLIMPYATQRIESGFDDFEAAYAEQQMQRLEVTLQERASTLLRTAIDYSRWDDTVEFVQGRMPEWPESNLTEDVFENFRLDTILVADASLRVLAASQQPEGSVLDPVAVATGGGTCAAAMQQRTGLFRHELVAGVPYLIACSPILRPADDAPVVGAMAWVQAMDPRGLAELQRQLQHPVQLSAAGPGDGPGRGARFDRDSIRVQVPVFDWDERTALLAAMVLPRPLGVQRMLTTQMMLVLLVAALAAPPLLMLLLLEFYVVRRIRRMSQWVHEVRTLELEHTGRQLPPPPLDTGFRELHMLTCDFAQLAERLETSRAEWQQEAMHDSLTRLGSRPRMLAELDAALQQPGKPVALLLADLDGFKAVNDMLGHPAGDQVLCEVARQLQDLAPAGAGVYRLGGDEFALLWTGNDVPAVEQLAGRLGDELIVSRPAAGRELVVTASVGACLAGGGDGTTVSELLAHADLALYEAKRGIRGSYRMFSADLRASYRAKIELELALRSALEGHRLEAWFQPITDARTGRVTAMEALARWSDPALGAITPDRFIAVAEQSGLILELDLQVSGFALRAFAPMHAADNALSLHVNVSAQSVSDPAFARRMDRLRKDSCVPADALLLELTESDLGVAPERLHAGLARLREVGLQLVVDDFGVGASSLGRLAQVRPVALKIDGSFVTDIEGDGGRICRAIIELARELGIATVAEYVETDAHRRLLLRMGCDSLQGYGVSPPMPADTAMAWLRGRPPVQWSACLPAPLVAVG